MIGNNDHAKDTKIFEFFTACISDHQGYDTPPPVLSDLKINKLSDDSDDDDLYDGDIDLKKKNWI